MKKPGMTHPPKKKHAAKPRAQVVRLTEEQQLAKARAEMRKAMDILSEAKALAATEIAPMACVHSAYYAMHHCAIAVLLVTGGADRFGDVPGSHKHVVEHFAARIESDAKALTGLVEDLRGALVDRVTADYDAHGAVSMGEATHLVAQAEAFLAKCGSQWPQLSVP
jgi:uncharacterized protein (UPF0332 family)